MQGNETRASRPTVDDQLTERLHGLAWPRPETGARERCWRDIERALGSGERAERGED